MVKKIYTIDEIKPVLDTHRDKKIVMCNGCFDLLHIGHINHLESAKKFGDILVVLVTKDKFVSKGPNRPIFNETVRMNHLTSLKCVDYVVINNWETPHKAIKILKPDYFAKGNDWKSQLDDDENIRKDKESIESIDGEMIFTDEISFSSSNIINSKVLSKECIQFLNDFKQKYKLEDIIHLLDKASSLNVLIIGETIEDVYVYGEALGLSSKASMVSLKPLKYYSFDGGILAIAKHLQEFTNVKVVTSPNRIRKTRYLSKNQMLFEIYNDDDVHLSTNEEDSIISYLDDNIEKFDMTIVADFGHGLLTKKIRDVIKKRAPYLTINTQANSGNRGHNSIRKYKNREKNIFICVDQDELRMANYEKYKNTHDLIDIITNELGRNNISIITRSSDGCIVNKNNTISIPAFTNNVVDAIGAGDALLSLTSLLAYMDAPIEIIGFVGNVAGAIACSYVCNSKYISKKELYNYMRTLLK